MATMLLRMVIHGYEWLIMGLYIYDIYIYIYNIYNNTYIYIGDLPPGNQRWTCKIFDQRRRTEVLLGKTIEPNQSCSIAAFDYRSL